MTAIAAREPASAISRAMVMEESKRCWKRQIRIFGAKQPVGDFHPQGVRALVAICLFQLRQSLFQRSYGCGCDLVRTLDPRQSECLKTHESVIQDDGRRMQRALRIRNQSCP